MKEADNKERRSYINIIIMLYPMYFNKKKILAS